MRETTRLTVGPAKGKFRGQLQQRRYVVRVHGLLKPNSVAVKRRTTAGDRTGQCGPGWTWDPKSRTTTIRLAGGRFHRRASCLRIQGAGTFADAIALQKALNLREQMRQAKRLMKLKHALVLLGGDDIKKPPAGNPHDGGSGAGTHRASSTIRQIRGTPPDFAAMRKRVLDALDDKPFESDRQIPESIPMQSLDEEINNGKFTADEKNRIGKILRGDRTSRMALSVSFHAAAGDSTDDEGE